MTYISLGSTCCISQQLKNFNLRKDAYPFDWVRISNLNNVIKLLENQFSDFLDFESFEFCKFSNDFMINGLVGSNIYKNKYCTFYHEFPEKINDINFELFCQKYKKRIVRFLDLIKSNEKITFIREELRNVKISKINKLIETLYFINPNLDYKIIVITNDKNALNYNINKVTFIHSNKKVTNWKRPELVWKNIFNI